MRVLQGLSTLVDADPPRGGAGRLLHDTFTCFHCQALVEIPYRCSPADAGGWCARCDAVICGACNQTGVCQPFEARLELAERRIDACLAFRRDILAVAR